MNTSTTTDIDRPLTPRPARPRRPIAAAATTAAVLIIGLAAVRLTRDDNNQVENNADGAAETPLELSLGAADTMASCLPLEVDTLATMSPAFAATATAVDNDLITLNINRWYTEGEASIVQMRAQPGQTALIAGFDFTVGQQYLITAADGTVNSCGYSGPATAELTTLFDQAFAD